MHLAPQYLLGLLPAHPKRVDAIALRLSPIDVERLKQSLAIDAANYYYSAIISFLDALLGLGRSLYSWATVKLYYSAFYALRCLLAIKGHCIYYCNEKPFTCHAIVGSTSVASNGTTHKVVLNLFTRVFSGDSLLSQEIAGESALEWLMSRREDANYKQGRFTEPMPPAHFRRVAELGVRRAINAYLEDSSSLYVFDPDHAMIAFPLTVLSRARTELRTPDAVADPESRAFLSDLGRDKNGKIAGLAQLL